MARRTGIPAITGAGNLQAPLEKMRELIEVGTGQNRGSNRDQWITHGDLIDMGVATLVGNPQVIIPGGNLVPVDAVPNPIVPPAPQNLIVTNGLSHVFLEWDNPGQQYQGHAYTTIYRSTIDDIGAAAPIGQTTSFVYADLTAQRGVTYYYWLRFTSETDIEGPPNAPNGTAGQLAPNPALVLDSLTGQITETQLYQSLNDRINLIDVTNGGLVNNLATETSARQAAVNSLQQQIDGLVVATDIEIFYQPAIPVDADANGGVLVDGSRWFDTDDNNHPYVYVNGAWQDARDQLILTVEANLTSETSARISADSAQVTRLDALEATVNNPITGVAANSTAIGGLTSTVTTQGNDISAQASDIASLESTVFDVNTGVGANAAAISGLQTTVATQGSDITSLTSQVSGLASTVENPTTGVAANAAAVSTLQTQVGLIDGELSSTASAVSTLQTTVGNNTAAIEVAQQSIDGIEGQYTVKIDVNGYVAGYGLSVTQNEFDGTQHSEMIFSVDRFSVGAPGSNELAFVVEGNQVVMDGALIKTATINTAQIGSLSVDKVTGLTSSFVLARIGTGNVTNAYIGDYIQSDTYASSGGANGWHIGKNGTAILNNVYARGDIQARSLEAGAANIVDTLHLRGEAVTVGSAIDSSGTSYGSSWKSLGAVTLNPSGGGLLAIFTAKLVSPYGDYYSPVEIRLLQSGVVKRTVSLPAVNYSTHNITMSHGVYGKYSTTIEVQIRTTAGVSYEVNEGLLFVLGVKR